MSELQRAFETFQKQIVEKAEEGAAYERDILLLHPDSPSIPHLRRAIKKAMEDKERLARVCLDIQEIMRQWQ